MRRDDSRFAAWFWMQVDKRGDGECWPWIGWGRRRNHAWYGVLSVSVDREEARYASLQQPLLAHRVVWELTHGPVPDGRCVLHRCDNPPCCNPAHLFVGTKGDNIRDAAAKGRAVVGEKNPFAKLTEEDVREIRRLYVPRKMSCRKLAKMFDCDPTTISLIIRRVRWAHVT